MIPSLLHSSILFFRSFLSTDVRSGMSLFYRDQDPPPTRLVVANLYLATRNGAIALTSRTNELSSPLMTLREVSVNHSAAPPALSFLRATRATFPFPSTRSRARIIPASSSGSPLYTMELSVCRLLTRRRPLSRRPLDRAPRVLVSSCPATPPPVHPFFALPVLGDSGDASSVYCAPCKWRRARFVTAQAPQKRCPGLPRRCVLILGAGGY
ncbi:hypothetical protein R3P38DRAFT_1652142 [Favolaschia claudopus]|uniref:Uncharacterized protein n=1 Tax=Favolaschia claudopus TaxID=2862362 RepID=A0AAW0DNU1_9AGAR